MSLKLFSPTPYASCFAIIKSWLTQSQAFDKFNNNDPTVPSDRKRHQGTFATFGEGL